MKVEGNQVTALKAGTTTLTGTVLGEAVSLDVTVQPASLEGTAVTLDQPQFTVTGSEIRPAVDGDPERQDADRGNRLHRLVCQ